MEQHRHVSIKMQVGILLLFCCGVGFSDNNSENEPWLKWEPQGGLFFHDVNIVIEEDGKTSVKFQKGPSMSHVYATELTSEEIARLHELIRQVDFIYLSAQKQTRAGPYSSTLWVKLDGKSHEITFDQNKEADLFPLSHSLWGLLDQANAIYMLREQGEAYPAFVAVNPQSYEIAFQPYRLVEPLEDFIQKSTDISRLDHAMAALARCIPPEQWFLFLDSLLKQADKERYSQYMILLTTHPFYANIPESHLQAMCPLLLEFLKKVYFRSRELSVTERGAVHSALRILGTTHYIPALGFLKSVFDSHDSKYLTSELIPILNMGSEGVLLLASYLEHPSAHKRLNAIKSIGMAYQTHRYRRHPESLKSVDNEDYTRMVDLFNKRLCAALNTLSEKDSSAEVQREARKALGEILHEIETWLTHQEKQNAKPSTSDSVKE